MKFVNNCHYKQLPTKIQFFFKKEKRLTGTFLNVDLILEFHCLQLHTNAFKKLNVFEQLSSHVMLHLHYLLNLSIT
jgi:hypothetical protein